MPYATLPRRATQLLCALLLAAPLAARENPRLIVIDVGYGLAVLAHDGEGATLLFDGGFREEASVMKDALAEAGVDSIALMVASHGHGDHLEGLTALLEEGFPVGLAAGNVPMGHSSFDSSFWRALGSVPYRQARPGDTLTAGLLLLHILHPDTLTENLNESSMAAILSLGPRRVLLSGDIGVHSQRALAAKYGSGLSSDILLAPHHGDVIVPEFWEAVQPRWLVVSVGPNPWGLPDPSLERTAAGTLIVDTRRDGTAIFALDHETISLVSCTPKDCTERREADMAERIRRWRRAH